MTVALETVHGAPAHRRRRIPANVRSMLMALAGTAVVWQIVGGLKLVADGAFPSLSGIATQFWRDRADYPQHVLATVQAAGIGFVIGVTIAVLAGYASVAWPLFERLIRGVGVTLFAVPLIALVPVLILALDGTKPRIVLAALAVYYPTMVATVVGLRDVDARLPDVVRACGGNDASVMRWVRLRSSLPSIMAGLRIAAPAALLGAILAEFGGGVRWGLGSYLLASLGSARPERLWGIGLVATVIAASAYGLFSLLGTRFTRTNVSATVVAQATPALLGDARRRPLQQRVLLSLTSIGIVLALWATTLRLLGTSPIVARSPLSVFRYLTTGDGAAAARHTLLAALRQTVPVALLGLAAGLIAALLFAVLLQLRRELAHAVLPLALVTQTMPLAALTPIIVLVFGRGIFASVMVCVAVTFFPSFVIIAQALTNTSPSAGDVVRSYGGQEVAILRFVGLPAAIPALLTAARLATPRALLGVMIAEYLATGRGLGFLLSQSRGLLDYGMIWSVAAVSVLVAIVLTQLVGLLERRFQSYAGA